MSLDYENAVRVGALVAAAAVVAGPWLVERVKATVSRIKPASSNDAHTVLEIAQRLKAAGNMTGVSLCQQLIDTMLNPKEPKK